MVLRPGFGEATLLYYVKVSYFTTEALALDNYGCANYKEILRSLKEAVFCKTWSLADGSATTIAPVNSRKKLLLLVN